MTAIGSERLARVVLYTGDKWEHVCPVIRVIGPVQFAGLDVLKGSDLEDGRMRILPELVNDADLVLIQRDFPQYMAECEQIIALAHEQNKPVIYELDDLLTELPTDHPSRLRYERSRADILQVVAAADAVTCSTPALCTYLRSFNPNTYVLPNYLNDQLWAKALSRTVRQGQADAPVIIGYLGSPAHRGDMRSITRALVQIQNQYGDKVRYRIWGMQPPDELLELGNVERLDPYLVDYAQFATYFAKQECDIFIAPLEDGLFNRSKSPLKYLEYSALGIPGVYSRIEPYERVIKHGDNGFLAGDRDEWVACLRGLIEDPELRYQTGQRAQDAVRSNHLLSRHAQEWREVFSEIAVSRKAPAASYAFPVVRELRLWHDELAERTQELVEDVEQARLLNHELNARMAEQEPKVQTLEAIINSPGWWLITRLGSIRQRLAPPGSQREGLFFQGMQSLSEWRRAGLQPAVRKTISNLQQRRRGRVRVVPGPSPLRQLSAGDKCPLPAVTVVVIKEDEQAGPTEASVLDWVRDQTYQAIEVITWDKRLRIAYQVPATGSVWECADLGSLYPLIHGRYVCIASANLLQQPETYLEANLICLESETLAFTVNAFGNAAEIARYLEIGRLPGSRQLPLLAQVVRKDCLGANWSFDLSAWPLQLEGKQRIVGKFIVHGTARVESPGSLPFGPRLPASCRYPGASYIVQSVAEDRAASMSGGDRSLYALDSVLPLLPDTSAKPTVMVLMPYLAVGGAERVALDVMRYLKSDIRFVVVTTAPHDPALGTTADAFRQVTPYVYTAGDSLLRDLKLSFLQYLIERFEPHTFYIANGESDLYDCLGALKQRYPAMRTANQVYDYRFGWINRYDADLVTNLDSHIGTNQKICDAYIECGARSDQVYLIENGVDTNEFNRDRYSPQDLDTLRQRLGLPQGHKIVTFMARLHSQKRPMDFVEMARRFSGQEGITFLLVGSGPLEGAVNDQLERMGLHNVVRRPFYRPSRDIYAVSDVYVLPSEYEGMPLVILEAQSMGRPVVVTDVGNTRQILETTQGGVLVARVGDIDGLKRGVEQMLAAPPSAEQVRQATIEHFDLAQVAARYRRALLGE